MAPWRGRLGCEDRSDRYDSAPPSGPTAAQLRPRPVVRPSGPVGDGREIAVSTPPPRWRPGSWCASRAWCRRCSLRGWERSRRRCRVRCRSPTDATAPAPTVMVAAAMRRPKPRVGAVRACAGCAAVGAGPPSGRGVGLPAALLGLPRLLLGEIGLGLDHHHLGGVGLAGRDPGALEGAVGLDARRVLPAQALHLRQAPEVVRLLIEPVGLVVLALGDGPVLQIVGDLGALGVLGGRGLGLGGRGRIGRLRERLGGDGERRDQRAEGKQVAVLGVSHGSGQGVALLSQRAVSAPSAEVGERAGLGGAGGGRPRR